MKKSIKIAKLDASRKQLEIAIRLYFSKDDPVSIHTLTFAAYNILRDLSKARGGEGMLIKDKALDHIKPEKIKFYHQKVNEAANFFKHANKYHDTIFEFYPNQTEIFIFDAILQYYNLTDEEPILFLIFRLWFTVNNPHIFYFPKDRKQTLELIADDITSMDRSEFFQQIQPLLIKLRM